jgi:hypothetical protein
MSRLLEGDPLELEARCSERLRAQALLLPLGDLHLRAIAHVARHGPSHRGTPPIDVWLAERVRKAVGELLEDRSQEARARPVPETPQDVVFPYRGLQCRSPVWSSRRTWSRGPKPDA